MRFSKRVKIYTLSGGLVSSPYRLRFGFGGDLFLSVSLSLCLMTCCVSECSFSAFSWSANIKDLGRVAVRLVLVLYPDLSSE